MWQRFTEKSRHAIVTAEQEAAQMHSAQVETEHLLLGLLGEVDSAASQVLQSFGVTSEKVRSEFALGSEFAKQEQKLSSPEIEELGAHFKVDPALVRQLESQLLHKLRGQSEKPRLKLSPQVKQILELAADESRRTQQAVKHSNYIGTEHLLLGLFRDEDGLAAKVLHKQGLNLEQARIAVIEYLKSKDDK